MIDLLPILRKLAAKRPSSGEILCGGSLKHGISHTSVKKILKNAEREIRSIGRETY